MSRLVWLQYKDTAIGACPKIGSSTVYASHDGLNYVRTRKPTAARKVFLTRNPIDRFVSLYQQKVVEGGKIAGLGTQLDGMSPEEFFKLTLAHDNHHWTPQVELLDGVDAELVPLIMLDGWWSKNMVMPLAPRQNVSKPKSFDITDNLIDDLRARYLPDIALHSKSLGGFRK